MNSAWTRDDIEAILRQLDEHELPFRKYRFTRVRGGAGAGLQTLGSGAFSNVYAAESRRRGISRYAIKVMGFADRITDPRELRAAARAQETLGGQGEKVVRLYGLCELFVRIEGEHTVAEIRKCGEEDDAYPSAEGSWLRLQFLAMERLTPILQRDAAHRIRLYPEPLARFDEAEIRHLAYDIGSALDAAHRMGLLHRDIKPENLFYSEREHCYKMGDFGIAKATDDGMASSIAFTRGYGAPEVVYAPGDRYDNTADIYSFGMTLYVLLNRMRFPASRGYEANLPEQYAQGFVPPAPSDASTPMAELVADMCSFYPENRYQQMGDVLNALEMMMTNSVNVRYKRENRRAGKAAGWIFACAGAVLWHFGFPRPSILLWSFAVVVLLQSAILSIRDAGLTREYFRKNLYWKLVGCLYLLLALQAWTYQHLASNLYWETLRGLIGERTIELIFGAPSERLWLCGFALCLIWTGREYLSTLVQYACDQPELE